jgi:hypothetical protein
VPQITEPERIVRIQQLLAERHTMPPERHETVHLPWNAADSLLEVILIGVDEVLLNPGSHRIRAQLEGDPEWEALGHDPFGEAAQRVIERHVREARTADDFAALKESLLEKQTEPGVITHKGLLINGNSRTVALREAEDPLKRYIRVAVLPPTANPDELTLLELRLQMQRELKVDYTMTNELLFIEELSTKRHLSAAQIAKELRYAGGERKAQNEVELRLKLLDLLRLMQQIPSEPLPLTFFDRIELQQLRELHGKYGQDIEQNPVAARNDLERFLLSVAVGVASVHQLRQIDADFFSTYMLPALEEDPIVGPVADALVAPAAVAGERPAGVDLLAGPSVVDEADGDAVDVARLIDAVTARDKTVVVPGTNIVIDQDEFKDALKTAISVGVRDKRRVEREEDQLAAPSSAVKAATQEVMRAKDILLAVHADPEFDDRRRKTLEAAHKKLSRACRDLDATLVKAGIVQKK